MQNILIIGAGSAIARSLARLYAARQCRIVLTGRDGEALERQCRDLQLRGASEARHLVLDVNDTDSHGDVIRQVKTILGRIDTALICHGTLPGQADVEHDYPRIRRVLETNGLSTIALLCALAPHFREQEQGCLAVITSVAGDRGRLSNYVYGTSKAMVSHYLQGLRADLFRHGVHVMDVRPGFVDTPMTRDFRKGLLWSQPAQIARIIDRGLSRRRHTLYAPWYWRYIMLVIRSIPEFIFKRLGL